MGSLLPSSLQGTCSLMGRSLTLVLVVTGLLEKMAGNKWPVVCHQAQTYMKSLKREWPLRPLSDSTRVMWCHMPQWPPDSSGIQQGSRKNIHQFPRVEDALTAWVLRSQGRYSTRFSVTRPETTGAGAGMMPRDGRLSAHLTHLTPVLCQPILCVSSLMVGTTQISSKFSAVSTLMEN